jgi:PIN domain
LKTDFVLVDFENVQPNKMTLLSPGPYKVKVFVGANQTKIPFEMARALQAFGPDAEYIQIDGHGRNALDFHIAYYIGRLAAESPDARLHVISKDTGFDPLIKHLNAKGISCQRSKSLSDVLSVKALNSERNPERVVVVPRKSREARSGQAPNTQDPPKYYQRTVWQSTQCGRR